MGLGYSSENLIYEDSTNKHHCGLANENLHFLKFQSANTLTGVFLEGSVEAFTDWLIRHFTIFKTQTLLLRGEMLYKFYF